MERLSGNIVLDIVIILLIAIGLLVSLGSGNWRTIFHLYVSKPKLMRLKDDARRVAEDIANTISQERAVKDNATSANPFDMSRSPQDTRFLSKHMTEAHSIIQRLKDVGYGPKLTMHQIGVAGATCFAAEDTCKELFASSERIRCDFEDGFITLLTRPQPIPSTEPETLR